MKLIYKKVLGKIRANANSLMLHAFDFKLELSQAKIGLRSTDFISKVPLDN